MLRTEFFLFFREQSDHPLARQICLDRAGACWKSEERTCTDKAACMHSPDKVSKLESGFSDPPLLPSDTCRVVVFSLVLIQRYGRRTIQSALELEANTPVLELLEHLSVGSPE